MFSKVKGVSLTAVGYSQGVTRNPTYDEVASGRTNHNEVVRVTFDPLVVGYTELLKTFWDHHDPTTPMRQGNDVGTQYRSGIYYHSPQQREQALESRRVFQAALAKAGHAGQICTEIEPAGEFYFAEEYHQQYDSKPGSRQYCGLRPLGVSYPGTYGSGGMFGHRGISTPSV